MKVKTLSALAGLGGALIMSGQASASYVNLSVNLYTTVTVGGVSRDVYRVYANFTLASDHVTAIAGSPIVGNLTIQNTDATGNALGTGFFNPGGSSSNQAPSSPASANYYGTYATIGISDATQGSGGTPTSPADETGLSPGFPTFIAGNQLDTNNAAWFTAGPVNQGAASWINSGYDTNLRVQIMQLAVNHGQNVRGTVSISGTTDSPLAAPFIFNGQTFNSVPAPGALALLGLAGLVGSRRRRA